MGCAAYVYQSKADQTAHELLLHPTERRNKQRHKQGARKWEKQEHLCVCGEKFDSKKLLSLHRNSALHRTPRKRKQTSQQVNVDENQPVDFV